jgi:hypothetical protein
VNRLKKFPKATAIVKFKKYDGEAYTFAHLVRKALLSAEWDVLNSDPEAVESTRDDSAMFGIRIVVRSVSFSDPLIPILFSLEHGGSQTTEDSTLPTNFFIIVVGQRYLGPQDFK